MRETYEGYNVHARTKVMGGVAGGIIFFVFIYQSVFP